MIAVVGGGISGLATAYQLACDASTLPSLKLQVGLAVSWRPFVARVS